jgi:hypothetical protein
MSPLLKTSAGRRPHSAANSAFSGSFSSSEGSRPASFTQTIRPWVSEGPSAGRTNRSARVLDIQLIDEIRAKFKPDVSDGYLPLNAAARKTRRVPPDSAQPGFEPTNENAIRVVDDKRPSLRIDANGDHDRLCRAEPARHPRSSPMSFRGGPSP